MLKGRGEQALSDDSGECRAGNNLDAAALIEDGANLPPRKHSKVLLQREAELGTAIERRIVGDDCHQIPGQAAAPRTGHEIES
jgi:hypothetical protein